jgi:hypothetical protein
MIMFKGALIVLALILTASVTVALPPAPHTGCFMQSADTYDDVYIAWYEDQCADLPEGPELSSCRSTGHDLASAIGSMEYESCMGNPIGGCSSSNPWCWTG